ncbi:ABC transporter ATP-binding protein [Nocardioides humi]|uniref:ABC transporter ATP-binding protein n=1 Tax=Nocardioides humi TaxID=449461 RepID=A0ABN1ZYV8_9ACTN|nr:ABC transporter ATP-binding protein [Nocardioides humi]
MTAVETHSQAVGPLGDGPVPPLAVEGLRTAFLRRGERTEIVRDVSFTLERGKTLMLLGESGSGKSVTARSVLQLYGRNADITGSVRMNGKELVGVRDSEMRTIRGGVIAMVPQDPTGALDPLRRIGSQIAEVIRVHQRTPKQSAVRRAEELLAQVGIQDPKRVAASYPHELSGGMRQRAVIAIAVSCDPQILIADEPTTALDVTVQKQILDLISTLREETGTAVLMVTHDVGVAADYGDRVAVMYRGRLIEQGAARSVLENPQHPYTQGLLAAQPRPGVPRGTLPTMIAWSPEATGPEAVAS